MGDDACWLDRTCLSCGRFLDRDRSGDGRCPHCGMDLPPPADDVDETVHRRAGGEPA